MNIPNAIEALKTVLLNRDSDEQRNLDRFRKDIGRKIKSAIKSGKTETGSCFINLNAESQRAMVAELEKLGYHVVFRSTRQAGVTCDVSWEK
jgi:hypothetical protein